MPNIGTLTISLVAQATAFERTMRQAQKTMEDATARMRKQAEQWERFGRNMSLSMSLLILAAGRFALKLSGQMEQAEIAFTQMLGSAERARQFLDDLAKFAEKTPFEFTELTEQARRLMAFGFAAQDVIPMLTKVGDAVAAMGSGAEGLDRITRAIGQMQAKQKAASQEMIQLTEAGIPAWQYLAEAIGKSAPETMKMVERGLIPAGEAIDAILSGMERDFGGLMAAQSKTMLGSLSNLKDALQRLGWTLGDAINRTLRLTERIQAITGWVSRAADALARMQPALKSFIVWSLLALAAVGPLAWGIGRLMRTTSDLARGLAWMSRWGARLAEGFALWQGGAGNLAEVLGLVFGKTRLIVAGILAAIAVTVYIARHWQELSHIAQAAWSAISAGVLYAGSLIARAIGYTIAAIAMIVPELQSAAAGVMRFADSMQKAASDSWASARSAWATARTTQQAADAQAGVADSATKAAKAQNSMAEGMEAAAEAAGANIQSFDEVHQIQEEMAQAPAATIPAPGVPTAELGLGDLGLGAVNLAETVSSAWTKVTTAISTAWDNLKAKAMETFPWLKTVIDSVSVAIQWCKDNWDELRPALQGVAGVLLIVGLAFAFVHWPVTLLIAGLTLLAAGISMLIANWQRLAPTIVPIWEQIKAVLLPIWDALKSAAVTTFSAIWQTVVFIWGRISEFWRNWGATILAILGGLFRQISIVVSTGINLVRDIIGLVLALIRGDWGAAWEHIKGVGITIWNFITATWENLKRTTADIWESIKGKLASVWESIKTTASNVWDGILRVIKTVINGVIKAINWMIQALNKISFTIPDWVPVLGGKSFGFNIAQIPLLPLAEGGIVTRPTPALIAERGPEVVRPLGREEAMVDEIARAVYQAVVDGFRIAQVGQVQQEREVVLRIDGTTFARLILPALIREGQRQGLNLVVQPGRA